MTTTTFRAHNGFESQDYELGVTNGARRVSISLRQTDARVGLGASLSPADARALASDQIARARSIARLDAEPGSLDWLDPQDVTADVAFLFDGDDHSQGLRYTVEADAAALVVTVTDPTNTTTRTFTFRAVTQ